MKVLELGSVEVIMKQVGEAGGGVTEETGY